MKISHKRELEEMQEEVTQAQSQVAAKSQYIDELEKQNDEIQSKFEKMGFDIMMQIKNDMFKQDQENDQLAEVR